MALTRLQQDICRLLASARRETGESYLADGVALSAALHTSRVSRDLDVLPDTTEAVARTWDTDRASLERAMFSVRVLRERPGYVEAVISRNSQNLIMEWARDSAFRFFPLIEHEDLGLTLHPFDLATNKVLALVGRIEARDWIDVMDCHERLQPLGYLVWAACGKDPGFSPPGILEQARRTARYTDDEISSLAFEGSPPRAADLSRRWHAALEMAESVVGSLPAEHVGQAVLARDGTPFTADASQISQSLAGDKLIFHKGRIGGAWPTVRS